MSDSSSGREPLEELFESFLARYRAGERPSLTEFTAAHPELADQLREHFPALLIALVDRHHDDFGGRETWRDAQPLVVAVRHDEAAHEARARPPARVPRELGAATLRLELEVEGLREVLAEVVRRARL